jgi:hypothetical protein
MKTAEDNFRPDEKGEPVIPKTSLAPNPPPTRQPNNTDKRVKWNPLMRFEKLYKKE